MNLKTSLLLILIANSLNIFSQDKQYHNFQLGISGGINNTYPTKETGTPEMSDFTGETKPMLSVVGIVPRKGKFSLQTELAVIRKVYNFKQLLSFPPEYQPKLYSGSLSEDHLQIPFLLRYELVKKPVISVLAGSALSCRIKSQRNSVFNYDNPTNAFEVSLQAGVQIEQPVTRWLSVFGQSKYDLMVYRNDIHKMNGLNATAGILYRLPVTQNSVPDDESVNDTVSGDWEEPGSEKPLQIGFATGVLRSFPENLRGATSFSISMIYIFDNYKKLSTEIGLTIYQKGFSATDWNSHYGSFTSTYLQVPFHVLYEPFENSGISLVYGIAGSCVISQRNTVPLYTEDLIYEISAHAGPQFELPLNNTISFITRVIYEYPLYRTDAYEVHALTGTVGLLFDY